MNYLLTLYNRSKDSYRFLLYSFSFTALILGAFVVRAMADETFISAIYGFATPIYYYVLCLILLTLFLPLFVVLNSKLVLISAKFVIDALLLADYFVFDIYRFHIDMLFINMLLYDFKGIGISFGLVAIALAVYGAVFSVNWWLYNVSQQSQKVSVLKTNGILFLVFIVSQLTHVVSYDYKYVPVTKYTPYLPYYAPLMSSSGMITMKNLFPSIFPQRETTSDELVAGLLTDKQSGLLAYPKQPLTCAAQNSQTDKPANILLFVAESWRQDSMTGDITPYIHQFSQQATTYNNHYSGGSVTVNGLFSLMYGLHPTYRDFMSSTPYQSQTLLTKELAKQGYDIDVYTSSNLDRFMLKAMFFGDIADDNYHNPMKFKMPVNDLKAVEALLEDLDKPTDKPWFKMVFLSSSHHSYQYPDKHKIFTPIEKNPEAFVFNKHMDGTGLFNDFKNSMHYVDSLFGKIWQKLEQTNQHINTMTVVTSDHGEEFNDNKAGYWGHGSNFTDYQVAVPMVIKMPNQQQGNEINTRSGHVDFVPTVFSNLLNCGNDVADYSSGFDLLNLPQDRAGLIVASYKDKAYIINDSVYATGLSVQSYSLKDVNNKNEQFDFKAISKLKEQESSFIKN